MTVAREAIYLPALCLTVTLIGGLRPGGPTVLPPPSLFSLVLAVLLLGVLIQSGALAPRRLLDASRSSLQNLNGVVLLGTVFLAAAQTFSLLTPESGLPRVLFGIYFLVLLVSTWAAASDRIRVLRSLAVTFGAAFILKFIVLDALSEPTAGRLGRVLQLLLEGVTLGAVTQAVQHPASGYLAFFTLVLFLLALALLPARAGGSSSAQGMVVRDY